MKKYLVGIISGLNTTTVKTNSESVTKDNEIKFYQSKELPPGFYNEDGIQYPDKQLKDLALLINSPWSQVDESYTIKANCKDAYTAMNSEDPKWKCEYEVVGYECITAVIVGYGNTEEEALADCKRLFKFLQGNYNKDNDSV